MVGTSQKGAPGTEEGLRDEVTVLAGIGKGSKGAKAMKDRNSPNSETHGDRE